MQLIILQQEVTTILQSTEIKNEVKENGTCV